MRRLSEILAFPRAWYRRSIVRRLFLGDVSVHTNVNVHTHNTTNNVPVSPVLPQREKTKISEPQKPKGMLGESTLILFK